MNSQAYINIVTKSKKFKSNIVSIKRNPDVIVFSYKKGRVGSVPAYCPLDSSDLAKASYNDFSESLVKEISKALKG